MRKKILQTLALGTACCVMTAQAQTPGSSAGSSASGTQDKSQSSPGAYQSSQSQTGQGTLGQSSTGLSATGRMGQQQHIKASKIEGAKVTSSSGQQVATVKDVIINPTSGRIDFALLSVSSAGAASATSPGATTTTTTPGITTTPGSTTPGSLTSSLTGSGKQVAVPWMLLRAGGAGSSAATTTTTDKDKDTVSFVFSGDASKLQNAPAFNESTDLSQPTWRQSVYSHYGLTSGAAAGGSYTPGGRTTGSSTDLDQPGSSSTTDPNQRHSTDPNQPRSSGSSGLGTSGSTAGGSSSSDRDNP